MSAIGGEYRYSILFTGNSSVGPTIEEIKQGLMTIGYTGDEAGKKVAASFNRSMLGIRSLVFGTQMAVFYFSMMETAAIRNENAAILLEDSQTRYNDTLREYGAGSQEAIKAGNQLERTQNYLTMANQRATLSYVGLGLQAVSFGVELVRQLPILTAWISKTWAATTAQSALKGSMTIPLVGAAVGVAAGLGAYALASATFNSNINVSGGNFEAMQAERDRQERYAYRRGVGGGS